MNALETTPFDPLADLRKDHPELADSIEKVKSLKKIRSLKDEGPEDNIAVDYSWLADFTYEGKKLTDGDMRFIIWYIGNRGLLTSSVFDSITYLGRPIVLAALHEVTKDSLRQFQVNPNKIIRELVNIIDSNITDICDVTAAGIALKDLSSLPRSVTSCIAEIHETRNAQGTQIKIKFWDKNSALGMMTRILGMNTDKLEVTVNADLQTRLAVALERAREPLMIEGELLEPNES